jgi:hypothetical protein
MTFLPEFVPWLSFPNLYPGSPSENVFTQTMD